MPKLRVGWIGDYRRVGKRFDLAYLVAKKLNAELIVAGPVDSELYVEREEMPNFYNDVDCLLVTSEWEAHPLIVYEALACGCTPFIEVGVGDVADNKVKGVVYYNGFNVDNIVKCIRESRLQKDAIVEAGLRCIREEWTWGDVKPQYEQMFRDISGKDYPKVTYLIDHEGWSWGYMADEIRKYVWRYTNILPVNKLSPSQVAKMDFANTDLIINNVWNYFNVKTVPRLPVEKHVVAVNNPSFLHPQHAEAFYNAVGGCAALTTTSLPIAKMLRLMGRPVYYATRGIDTELFRPKP